MEALDVPRNRLTYSLKIALKRGVEDFTALVPAMLRKLTNYQTQSNKCNNIPPVLLVRCTNDVMASKMYTQICKLC